MLCCRLNSCCCGCSLKTGTVVIATLEIIGSILSLILSGILIYLFSNNINQVIDIGNGNTINSDDIFTIYRGIYIAVCVFSAFLLLINILLLVGVGQQKSGYFLPWIIYEAIIMLATLVLYIVFAVQAFRMGSTPYGVSAIIYSVIYFVVRWYFVSVVHSYYRQIKGTNNRSTV